ncbi:hypothetical protein CN918_25240 [Priestia megaterium]|nr:hypothetical protein CN918_25240 [Priestia megaterium]
MNEKQLSAGLILTDGLRFLGCHSTGNNFHDLPKGKVKVGELPIDACVREVDEETGLSIIKNSLIDLGEHAYNGYKNLYLFALITDNLPNLDQLFCTSTFYHQEDKIEKPEADGYMYIPFANMREFVTLNMHNVLNKVVARLDSKTLKKAVMRCS